MQERDLKFRNARLVLADQVVERGWLTVQDGLITGLGAGQGPAGATDLAGDTLIPGLVELHTDHLEAHFQPRPGVVWHSLSAVLSYDAQIAAAGITTVFDSLRVGADERKDVFTEVAGELSATIMAAGMDGVLRAEHFTHLRCEVCSDNVIEAAAKFMKASPVRLLSLMDHTPGQRQFRDLEPLKVYYRAKLHMSEAQIEAFIVDRLELHARNAVPHRHALIALARQHKVAVASHDDSSLDQVAEAIADGVSIAEFPTTIEAAAASHQAGIKVLMGAPNVVRGGSHSGNVAAADLARAGTLDILSSDYVPASLLLAVWRLTAEQPRVTLPAAVAMVTRNPAKAAGFADRGEIAVGLRADLVRLRVGGQVPVVRSVWRQGARVL